MIQLDCQCQIKDLTFTPSVFRNPTLDTTQKTPIPCDSGPCGLWIPIFGGRHGMRNSLCRWWNVDPNHKNLISSKIAKHADVLKWFGSIALRIAGLQQLLHHDCNNPLLRNIGSDSCHANDYFHFPMRPSYLVRNNSV